MMSNNVDYKYKVSVIVPVYNAINNLNRTIESLLNQTIFKDIEVILINDGSTDNSLELCLEYSNRNENIITLTQENLGVSSARNFGISKATGKYIMYLDADDTFTPETVEIVYNYFEQVYDTVDMVSYPERKYINDIEQPLHFRYRFLKKTGIYDLNKFFYITQSRINIAVKNDISKDYFDSHLFSAEDQEYIGRILSRKMKIGYIDKGLYQYHLNSNSVSSSKGYVYYVANVLHDYYKKMFDQFEHGVPKYFQAMFLYDINWKIRQDQLWPYHFDKSEFNKFKNDFIALLTQCDLDVLMKHPALDEWHKFYLLKILNSSVNVIAEKNNLKIVLGNKLIAKEDKILIVVTQLKMFGNNLKLLAHLKSFAFSFAERPQLIAHNNDQAKEIQLFESNVSRYKSKIKTNTFWAFYYEIPIEDTTYINFTVKIDGIEFNTKYCFMPYTSLDYKDNHNYFIYDRFLVEFKNQGFCIKEMKEIDLINIIKKKNLLVRQKSPNLYDMRKAFDFYNRKKYGSIMIVEELKKITDIINL